MSESRDPSASARSGLEPLFAGYGLPISSLDGWSLSDALL
jgi:hypothetical protein